MDAGVETFFRVVVSMSTGTGGGDDFHGYLSSGVHLEAPFIRSGQNRLARHSERGKKTRQTEEEVGRQHQGMDRPGVRQVPKVQWRIGKMEETGCEIIYGAPTIVAVRG